MCACCCCCRNSVAVFPFCTLISEETYFFLVLTESTSWPNSRWPIFCSLLSAACLHGFSSAAAAAAVTRRVLCQSRLACSFSKNCAVHREGEKLCRVSTVFVVTWHHHRSTTSTGNEWAPFAEHHHHHHHCRQHLLQLLQFVIIFFHFHILSAL